MSRTGRFRVLCFLLFGSFLLLAATLLAPALRAQSDPMAKWKPNVGDRFTYYYSYHHSFARGGWPPDSTNDTIIETIASSNFFFDSAHPSVVAVRDSIIGHDSASQLFYFWFYPSNDSGSMHPLEIETGLGHSGYIDTITYNFSKSPDSITFFNNRSITCYLGSWGNLDANYNGSMCSVEYTPDLKWFFSMRGLISTWTGMQSKRSIPLDNWEYKTWDYTLISVERSSSGVTRRDTANDFDIITTDNGKLLIVSLALGAGSSRIDLLDILGRPVRTWAMEVAAGESQITLNVADVPSGVYFLKLSAPGVEEVRKVCIAH